MSYIDKMGMFAAIVMPLFNIPLIIRIIKRKSSEDISLLWAIGVWVCIILMAPSGIKSDDMVFRTFNISNVCLFTLVVIIAIKYRRSKNG
ncbi:MAG: hypothetical protein A2Y03_01125 [Omnitrophica WOR_2 bacterium GWF2_38_59]|nr:MAG: hypothetical protein A2Y06_05225 [Omnitrophica WOR_2 bacterium GWA2_37_7]OGX23300.1 MAG: hypothetical protein A2Y03_01125 [Omnitrophica WOR_2 bacterium GWF2_38_59]OGX46762.1 MAG: hypothetical protein A2243_02670 [Omnitrophica WOR_2 bacterium RIFOXYA2_FULL_38_17]OGX52067.1 MAG: hypothetical protein A2267_04405 [Omnitrophica WOR_2 bacterium RIFOXYA12_FULL_38_10]OGX58856.1 MAG: hypothetical protein A2447_09450 [Omnitrophica WOR_2 bacterium RIFOXYC2_FULL_38_12]OGX59853.1 MAG: hypothetical 